LYKSERNLCGDAQQICQAVKRDLIAVAGMSVSLSVKTLTLPAIESAKHEKAT
jgi:hypothetical protein